MHRISASIAASAATKPLSAICGGLAKRSVMRRKINLADEPIGGLDLVNPGELELLRQPILQCPEHPLRAPARLRRIGRNMLDAKPSERAPNLRQLALVDRLP